MRILLPWTDFTSMCAHLHALHAVLAALSPRQDYVTVNCFHNYVVVTNVIAARTAF